MPHEYDQLSQEDKREVDRLIFQLWKQAGGSLNPPSDDLPPITSDKE